MCPGYWDKWRISNFIPEKSKIFEFSKNIFIIRFSIKKKLCAENLSRLRLTWVEISKKMSKILLFLGIKFWFRKNILKIWFLVTPKNSIGGGGQLVRICDGKNQSNQLINIQQIPQSIQIIQQNCVINGQNLVSFYSMLVTYKFLSPMTSSISMTN